MHAHRDFFIKNPRLNMLLKTYDSWSDGKRNSLLSKAEDYLKSLDKIL
jgi:deoxyribodipyrimidine photolyase-related protein